VLFKKCTGCKREFTKAELEEIQSKQKASKKRLPKNTCPDCREPLKIYDESRFQKKWYGYLNNDKRMIDHLVLVEFNYYDDDSFEVKVPLLNLGFETKDFSEAINIPDENISIYLKDKYEKVYDSEHKILMQAFIKETTSEKQNVTAWW
jgi:ssDNA-binding Zn-finger/Zn-ribbon topoisomerase 1